MDAVPSTSHRNEPTEPQEVVVRREPERDLVTWKAQSRPFKKRDRQYFVTIFAIAGIVSLVIFLAEGLMPVILIVTLVFLYYILSTVPPDEIEYKVTTRGIMIADKLTPWAGLVNFWFGRRMDTDILFFDTLFIPGRMELVIHPQLKDKLKTEISAYIPYQQAPVSGLDKITDLVAKKLPGNS